MTSWTRFARWMQLQWKAAADTNASCANDGFLVAGADRAVTGNLCNRAAFSIRRGGERFPLLGKSIAASYRKRAAALEGRIYQALRKIAASNECENLAAREKRLRECAGLSF